MFKDLIVFAFSISGCAILVKGIGAGVVGMSLIVISAFLLICLPRKNHHDEYDPWYDI